MRKQIGWLIIFALIVTLGCERKDRFREISIEVINTDPEKFYDQECVVRGLITQIHDIPFVKHDVFKIHDGTGEIWIYSEIGAPPDRIEVLVKGTLKKFLKLPFKLPIISIEIDHYIKLQKLTFLRI